MIRLNVYFCTFMNEVLRDALAYTFVFPRCKKSVTQKSLIIIPNTQSYRNRNIRPNNGDMVFVPRTRGHPQALPEGGVDLQSLAQHLGADVLHAVPAQVHLPQAGVAAQRVDQHGAPRAQPRVGQRQRLQRLATMTVQHHDTVGGRGGEREKGRRKRERER